ncbi:MAG: hypothetical protein KGL39_06195 [Patescibacteria group bacterium]|nr:hypothetical protein [Patescibacteria group bacterium]
MNAIIIRSSLYGLSAVGLAAGTARTRIRRLRLLSLGIWITPTHDVDKEQAMRPIANSKAGIRLRIEPNLAGDETAFVDMYGASVSAYTKGEAKFLAEWLEKRFIPELLKWAKT